MPAKHLSDAFVRNVRLPRKSDTPNQISYIDTIERGLALVLVVSYGGSRTFRCLTYDANGRPKTRKLGRYPAMKVKDARAKAREYFENPEKVEEAAAAGTFENVAENWLKRHVAASKLRSEREIRRHLSQYIFPKWKDLKFVDIRRGAVNDLLDTIADDHGVNQADACLATIRSICNWYTSRNEHYVSPIVPKMRRDKRDPEERKRKRYLNDDEIRAVWKAAGDTGAFAGIIKLCLLTDQRSRIIAAMRWDDVRDGTWTIPHERRAKGNIGRVKLPPMALGVIEAQPQIAGNPHVFAARGIGPFNSWSQHKAELDAKLPKDMPHWTVHDLRHTARSLMSRSTAGIEPEIAERVMGHTPKASDVQDTYDHHDYYDEKSDALARLAALIESIIKPREGNVVAMRRRSRK